MTAPDPWSSAAGWREFFDLLSDAVVVLDGQARVVLCNIAALRLLPCEAGAPVDQLRPALGAAAIAWLKRAIAGEGDGGRVAPPAIRLADGRAATLAWRRLDAEHSALHLAPSSPAPRMPLLEPVARAQALGGMREAIGFLWESPFPISLQGPDFRFLDVNTAFAELLGRPREQIIGRDAIDFQPEEDRARIVAARERIRAGGARLAEPALVEGRLVDASGRERRYRVARRTLVDEAGRPLYLGVLQDMTAEHVARERADRSLRELDDWFDLSPVGMVLFDERGLFLRSNPAFDALTGPPPVELAGAPAELRALLGWDDANGLAALEPGSVPVQRQGSVAPPEKPARLLRAVLRCYRSAGGQRRYMAIVEDRSAEEERDLAQLQIGALMDTAGVGLATFQEASGWMRLGHGARADSGAAGSAASLQSIGRDLVTPASLAEFERLQSALRHGERAEVHYAIEHPELGRRWLLTRVEPATLGSGKRTTSVVTLDITEQHETQERTEQLLHELSTILESTTTGIAYLRGDALVRCNRRFEAMLGASGGAVVGRTLEELFAHTDLTGRIVTDAWQALAEGTIYETEFEARGVSGDGAPLRSYSLSVRRTGPRDGPPEAIAVLADITRLKAQQRELEILARDRELMFSLSGVGIAFLRGGRIQRANQALAHLAGCSVAELATLGLADLFPDDAAFERHWAQVEAQLRQHGHWTGEHPLRTRDGRLLWVQVSQRLVTPGDPAGGIIASYVNVDARHRAERAVALQAERTRAILDSVLVGIVTVGPQGIEWMNRSARRMFGGDLADFVNLPIATVATGEPEHPFLRTEYLTELVEGQAETFECRVLGRDGRVFWVVGNVVSTARESTGRQLTYALLDMERRREAEARMSEAQAQLQRIIEAAPLAITLRDARTLKVLQINAAAAANRRAAPAALIGLTPEQMYEPATAASRRADMEAALGDPEVTRREYVNELNGEAHVWDVRYLPLASPGQPADQLLMVSTDITEQRAAQEARLEAAIAQREMLVREVHHRIKNNLQGVAGLLQQIAQKKPEVAGPISEVVGQVQAIAQVYGLQVGESGPLQLMSVAKAITASVQRTFGRPIRFAVTGTHAAAWLLPEAESIPIALTLNELLTNAVKHSAATPDGEVACLLACDEAQVAVTISNPGVLPAGFDLTRIPGGVSGLGLVRALLPRRSATLALAQHGAQVRAVVALGPPGVTRLDTK